MTTAPSTMIPQVLRWAPVALAWLLMACPGGKPHRYVEGLSYEDSCDLQLCWREDGDRECRPCSAVVSGIFSDGSGPNSCDVAALPPHAEQTVPPLPTACGAGDTEVTGDVPEAETSLDVEAEGLIDDVDGDTADEVEDAQEGDDGGPADVPEEMPDTLDDAEFDTLTDAQLDGDVAADADAEEVEIPTGPCEQMRQCLAWCEVLDGDCFAGCFPPTAQECLGCTLKAIGETMNEECAPTTDVASCMSICGNQADPIQCAEDCGFLTYAGCLLSNITSDTFNLQMQLKCQMAVKATWCADCKAENRFCDTRVVGLCGACRKPFVEDEEGVCQATIPCPEVVGCGSGTCEGGKCACNPGAVLYEGTCVEISVSNTLVPIVSDTSAPTFFMGETGIANSEPCREVTMSQPFSIHRYEVTRGEYAACVAAGACQALAACEFPVFSLDLSERPTHAVTCVSHENAVDYCSWIHARLPSEAEWAFVAHGSASCEAESMFAWGNATVEANQTAYSGSTHPFIGDGPYSEIAGGPTTPVGFFDGTLRDRNNDGWLGGPETYQTLSNATSDGIYDLTGSAEEWLADCWHPNFTGAPPDNTAWTETGCEFFVTRGGHYANDVLTTRYRNSLSSGRRPDVGFRCAGDL